MPDNLLGISTFVLASPFGDDDLPLFASARQMGYQLVELCVEDPTLLTADRVREAAQDVGVRLSIGGAFGSHRDLSHRSGTRRRAGLDYLVECIELAAAVGAPIVSGPMYSAAGKARMLSARDREAQRRRAVANIQVAAEHASDRGVTLAIEPLNRFETDLVNTVDEGIEFCRRVDRDNVGLTLDTFHMGIEEKHLGSAIRAAGPWIRSFQASDNDRGAPGSGHLPWSEMFDALDAIDYRGPIVVESFRPDAVAAASSVSLWRSVASSMDELARQSYQFLDERLGRRGAESVVQSSVDRPGTVQR